MGETEKKYRSISFYGSPRYIKRFTAEANRRGMSLGKYLRYLADIAHPELREPDYEVIPETAEDARDKQRGASGKDELEGELETLSA